MPNNTKKTKPASEFSIGSIQNETAHLLQGRDKGPQGILSKHQNNPALRDIMSGYDVRNISPREIGKMSHDLYEAGIISFEQHGMLSFHPELNEEQYNAANAVQGIWAGKADPDRKRDFIQVWEQNLANQKSAGVKNEYIRKTEEILNIVKDLDFFKKQTNLIA